MNISGIYKIQSKIKPERIYIGNAIHLKRRWDLHLANLHKNKHHSRKLQNHYNKYGEDDLIFAVIEPCFPEFLIVREQYYLDNLNPYFNIRKIANSNLGIKKSIESIEKTAKRNRGKVRTPEQKMKMSISHKGIKFTEERKQKISEANKGKKRKPISEDTRKKMSIATRGQKRVLGKRWKLTLEQSKYRSICMKLVWEKRKQNKVA